MSDLAAIHPLVLLGGRLAAAVLVHPLAAAGVMLTLGRTQARSLREAHPFAEAALHAVAAAGAGLVLGVDALDPRLVGATICVAPLARAASAVVFAVLACGPLLPAVRRGPREPLFGAEGRAARVILAVTALVPFAALVALRLETALPADALADVSVANAPLRAAVVPSDGAARLALAYRFATAGELDRARAEVGLARALGAEPARLFEVESELAARMGDCPGAERLFRLALEASMPRGPGEFARAPLRLGGFHLPPSLVTRCRFGAHGRSHAAPR